MAPKCPAPKCPAPKCYGAELSSTEMALSLNYFTAIHSFFTVWTCILKPYDVASCLGVVYLPEGKPLSLCGGPVESQILFEDSLIYAVYYVQLIAPRLKPYNSPLCSHLVNHVS